MARLLNLFLLLILFGAQDASASMTGVEAIERLQNRFGNLRTLSARFVKYHHWRLMDQRQEIRGRLYVQRPNRFKFESDAQVVVTDGETAWNYAPANAQVLISDYATVEKDRSYEKLLFDLIFLGGYGESYAPTYAGEARIGRAACHIVDLSAKKDETYIHKIRLWIDRRLWLVRQVEYHNIHDDVTTFALSDLEVDRRLGDDLFTFQLPSGVESVDLR